jgi:hypothetical protein
MSAIQEILNSALASSSSSERYNLIKQAYEQATQELAEAQANLATATANASERTSESMSYTIDGLTSDKYSVSIWTVNSGDLPSRYPNTVDYYLVDEGMQYRSPTITDITVEY